MLRVILQFVQNKNLKPFIIAKIKPFCFKCINTVADRTAKLLIDFKRSQASNQMLANRAIAIRNFQKHVSLLAGLRIRKNFGWSRNLTKTRSRSQIFYPTLKVQLNHFCHRALKLGILTCACWNGTISFETFIEVENSCCALRFPSIASCYKISYLQLEEPSIIGRLQQCVLFSANQARSQGGNGVNCHPPNSNLALKIFSFFDV